MDIKPRSAAAQAVEKIMNAKHFSNKETALWIQRMNWSQEDQRLFMRLVYGTLENLLLIDAILSRQMKRPVTGIDSAVRGLLRISVYQLLFTDRIPDYAIVNEAVELVKNEKPKATGFVNGVLRSIMRLKEEAKDNQAFIDQFVRKSISLRYSHPEWLISRLKKDYPEEHLIKILEAHQRPPIMSIRLNLLKGTTDELEKELLEEGILIKPTGWLPEAYWLMEWPGVITQSKAYMRGLFQIQSLTSMLAVHWLDPQERETIIDVAAAPGGKTTHIAERMNNLGQVIARDISAARISQVEIHAQRLGCYGIKTEVVNGTLVQSQDFKSADRVLVDAPCSSLGMIRKKPELKMQKVEKDLNVFPDLQLNLLLQSSQLVKPGGYLLYATCTYLHAENQSVVQAFLSRKSDFALVPMEPVPEVKKINKSMTDAGYIQMGPHLHPELDGFFVAKFQRERK